MTTTDDVMASLFPTPVIKQACDVAGGLITPQSTARRDIGALRSLVARFDSEERCRTHLERLRWPEGVRCPRCDERETISSIEKRGQFDCGSCGYQFSVRVGTVLQNSHLPLWKWFLAAYVMSEAEHGVSANRLKELLGVPYKTAWYLCHRIRAAMKDPATGSVRSRVDAGPAGRRPYVSEKHLPKYLDEMAFRSSNRGNPHRFRDILLRLIDAESIPYTELIA
jgi:transposase-like protein